MASSEISVGEVAGAVAQAIDSINNVAQNGLGSTLTTVDAGASVFGGALTVMQAVATWAGASGLAYNLGLGAVVANIAAFDVAKAQMEAAAAAGDVQAFNAAVMGALSAGAGIVAGIPVFPPPVRAAALAASLSFAFLKSWISNGDNIQAGFDFAWADLKSGLGNAWDAWTTRSFEATNTWESEGWRGIDPLGVNTSYNNGAQARAPRARDPLAIDLDGDGIETSGSAANPVLFDHNADGIRAGTGWIRPDDAWLALDRDGNGLIDSGRELFGVDTLLTGTPGVDAVYASTGFEALRTLDANADNVFDASDAAFTQVRLWQDINQDGVSQAGELFTLADKGIASISLNASTTNINLGNGNTVSGTATVTHSNGSTTEVDAVGVSSDTTAANLNLGSNPFYREFATPVPLTQTALDLPEMRGSGWVRDLREAMSLGSIEAQALAAKVAEFAAAGTRQEQLALLDEMLRLWAATNQTQPIGPVDDPHRRFVVAGDALTSARLQLAIPVLEVFNGMDVDDAGMQAPVITTGGDGQPVSTYGLFANQAPIMLAGYDALKQSVYAALVVQTRLEPYLDSLSVVIDEAGVRLESADLANLLSTKYGADASAAIEDLADLQRFSGNVLRASGYDGQIQLRQWVEAVSPGSPLEALLAGLGIRGPSGGAAGSGQSDIYFGDAAANQFSGMAGDDHVDGGAGNDTLNGDAGQDVLAGGLGADNLYGGADADFLAGGDGNDSLFGGAGDDELDGGAGNDVLAGDAGKNVYWFGRGDGQDSIAQSNDGSTGKTNVLRFKAGVAPSDLRFGDAGTSTVLEVSIAGTTDKITINGFFVGLDPLGTAGPVQRFEFAEGTVWGLTEVLNAAYRGTSAADTYRGTVYADALNGQGGNDTLRGYDGNDTLDGGAGDDSLEGQRGNNVYLFGRGDGQDTVVATTDPTAGRFNTLRFKEGVAPADIALAQSVGPLGPGLTLEVRIAGTADMVTLSDFFFYGVDQSLTQNPIQQFEFADGTVWDVAHILGRLYTGTAGADQLRGTVNDDLITGQGGDDVLYGGYTGNDTLNGGVGYDLLNGEEGNDTLIDGEVMAGGDGSDAYVLSAWQSATINEAYQTTPNADTLILPIGSTASTVQVIGRDTNADGRPNDLVLRDSISGQEVTLTNYFYLDQNYQVESIQLGDGTTWTLADIAARDATHAGTAGNDTLYAYAWGGSLGGLGGNDTLWGGVGSDSMSGDAGNDYLRGDRNADTLLGGDGNDRLDGDFDVNATANDGDDVLDGGAGNDTLFGGGGNDVYQFGRGDGIDTVTDVAGANRIRLDSGVAEADVTLFKEGANLILVVDQGSTQLTVVDQFHASGTRISSIEFAGGAVWDAAAIQARTVAGSPNAMTGTAGNDTFVVDDVGDTIAEGAGQGTDSVQSAVSYTLPTNVENLTLTGYLNANATGNALNNTITGNSSNNTLYGVDGTDTLIGGAGDDTYRVNWNAATALFDLMSNDTIVEAANGGVDTVVTSVYDFTLPANVENLFSYNNWQRLSGATGAPIYRQLIGNELDNFIDANASQLFSFGAYIDGGIGADTMRGTSDNDTYVIDNPGDVIIETGGAPGSLSDTVLTPFDHTADAGIENITLTGSAAVAATGNDANNVLDGSGNGAANVLTGGLGNDTYRIGAGDVIVEEPGQGTDTVIVATGGVGTYSMAGFAGIENVSLADTLGSASLEGNDADNVVTGNSSNNTLFGLGGNDTITDGAGTTDLGYDTLLGGSGNDTLTSFWGQDRLDGGAGDDLLQFARLQASGTVVFGKGMGHDVVVGGWASATKRVEFKADTQPGDVVYTRNGADLIATIPSTGDSLTLSYFFVDAESWTPTGEFNTFEFTAENLQFSAAGIASRAQTGNSNVATVGNDLMLGGGANDTFDGLSGNDTLTGGDGDDDLAGGPGGDSLYGGAGSDTFRYAIGDGFDRVYESGGTADRVRFIDLPASDINVRQIGGDLWFLRQSTGEGLLAVTNFFYGSQYEIEAAEFSDGATWDNATIKVLASQITGTSGADALSGSSGNDSIYGLAGNDSLSGLDGDDLLDGGTGNDTMVGGPGNDTFVVDSTSDVTTEASGQGLDTVQASITYTLSSSQSVENLVLTGTSAINGTGNTLANTITGNSAANALNGGSGADTLIGGAGNDSYTVDNAGDVVIELVDEGTDLVTSSLSHTLAANVENLTLSGSSGLSGTGNALDNVLTGNSGANTLTGGAGNDRLNGGTGNDTMVGGTGDDTYVVNVSTDVVTELAGEGTDTVESSVTLTLGSGNTVENLTLTGSSGLSATGNGLNNVLRGNSGANTLTGNGGDDTLDGGAGNDTLRGGVGNDTYVVGTGDTVTENASEGTDTVQASITWTLGSNLENLTLTGTNAINGTGNTLANVLVGNSGANTLSGAAGNDTYDGGAGNDALTDNPTTASNDVFRWGIGHGVDTITDTGGTDRVELGAGITAGQVVFTRVGNNLELTVSGNTADKLVVSNWYVGTTNRIEDFRLSDGSSVPPGQIPASLTFQRETLSRGLGDGDRLLAAEAPAQELEPAITLWDRVPLPQRWTMLSLKGVSGVLPLDPDAFVAADDAPLGFAAVGLAQQAQLLASAMAGFAAAADAGADERQTIQPVHRPDVMWVSPAVM